MKKITFYLFSLFCVVSLSVNAQDDGSDVAVNTCGTSYLCDGTTALGAGWDADCEDGSDEILSYCCENNFSFYVDGGFCGDDSGDDSADSTVDPGDSGDDSGDDSADSTVDPGDSGDDSVDSTSVEPVACEGVELLMTDSYGDGWNGAALNINGVNYTVEGSSASACVDTSVYPCNFIYWVPGSYDYETSWSFGDIASGSNGSGSTVFGDGCVTGCNDADALNFNPDADIEDNSLCEYDFVSGCTDNLACNFNPEATQEDYSCTYPQNGLDCDGNCEADADGDDIVSINLFDSYGDGGGSIALGEITAYNSGSSTSTLACVDLSVCNFAEYGATDLYAYENSWTITLGDSVLASGGPESGTFGVCVSGCSDANASNYNPDADVVDDSLCEFALVQGCIDSTACNYDSAAEQDNGSCEYPDEGFDCDGNCASGALLTMVDSYGDGWNGAALNINGVDYTVLNYGTVTTTCVDTSGCLNISWVSGSFDYETSWSLDTILSGSNGSGAGQYGSCVSGCSDSLAVNYNPDADVADNSLCEYPATCDFAIPLTGSDSSNTGVMGWFTFEMIAAGSANIDVAPVTDFPEFIETAVYSDCDSTVALASALDSGTYFVNVVQTVPEIGDVDFAISVDITIPGCTDVGAANYYELATDDDGSCIYIFGCTDVIAENYNPDATDDDGSCEYISGCTDDGAINFNPAATLEDGSCQYVQCLQTAALLTLNTASSGSSVSFTITDLNNQILAQLPEEGSLLSSFQQYEVDLCLSDANSYTAVLSSSSPNGWSGGSYEITTCDGQLLASSGTLGVDTSYVPSPELDSINTCGTSYLCDGTFEYGNASWGYDCLDESDEVLGYCCFNNFTNYVGLELCDGVEEIGAYDGVSSSVDFNVQDCDTYVFGCMDTLAFNFDSLANAPMDSMCRYYGCTDVAYLEFDSNATDDDGSCLSLIVEGCMDTLALNFDSLANVADNSGCEFAIVCEDGLTGIELRMQDSFGDGWNGALFVLTGTNGEQAFSGAMPSGYSNFVEEICLAPDCYSYSVGGGTYDYEITWSIAFTDGGDAVINGDAPESGYISIGTDESCSEDNFALGCMDQWASNYDPTATTDDGSCTYANNLSCDLATNIAFDQSFNGQALLNIWYSFSNDIEGALLLADISESSSYDFGYNVYSGNCDSLVAETAELSPGDYLVEITTTSQLNTNYSVTFSLEEAVEGCMEEYASNYDPTANISTECIYACDGVATSLTLTGGGYPGEMYWELVSDSGIVEASGGPYLSSGLVDSIPLCLDAGSSYVFNAYDDYGDGWNGATYSLFSECDSVTTFIQANNGGVSPNDPTSIAVDDFHLESSELFTIISCDSIVSGCTAETADNYNADANLDDGSCEYLGCTDSDFAEYDPSANVDDGSCLTELCSELETTLVLTLIDSYGDTWNGGSITIDSVVYTQPTENNSFFGGQASDSYDVCFDLSKCIEVTYTAGSYSYENSWNIALGDSILASGGDESGLFGDGCIEGCMDTLANNYDSLAVIENGSCEYLGCTDAGYAEYDPNANVDDGSCLTANCLDGETGVNLVVDAGAYPGEVSWKVETCDGAPLIAGAGAVDTSYCSSDWPEAYRIIMLDSFGDGWDGATLTLNGTVYGSNFSSGSQEIAIVGDCGFGCTDSLADNYDSLAVIDNGSCEFLGCTNAGYSEYDPNANVDDGSCSTFICSETILTLNIMNSSGNGGGSLEIDTITYELVSDSSALFDVCADMSLCTQVDYVATSASPSQVSWTISLGDSIIAEGGGLGLGSLSGTFGNCIEGCMDPAADNYNADANLDSGDCTYSCDPGETSVTITMMDSYGDGWTGNAVGIAGASDTSSFTLLSGAVEVVTGCVNLNECTSIYPILGTYPGEVSWTVADASGTLLASWDYYSASSTDTTFVGDCYFPGCTDPLALNYDADATDDDGSCIAVVEGCLDENYAEYDSLVNVVNPDSCLTFLGTCNQLSLSVGGGSYDYEISWSITALDDSIVIESGVASDYDLCLDDGCYTFNLYDSYGDGWNGANALLVYDNGESLDSLVWNTMISGSSAFKDFDLNGDCQFAVLGCTDEGADNYDPEATEDDGSCFTTVNGCTDFTADNYNPSANNDDGSCYYSCPDGLAQVDILVTTDTYSGTENTFTVNADGTQLDFVNLTYNAQITTVTNTYCVDNGTTIEFILDDSYGDGIFNGGYEIYVCQESLTGFVPMTDVNSLSEEFMAVCGDINGCTDETALNYNPIATADDGSCTYPCSGFDATVTINTLNGSFVSEISWVLSGPGSDYSGSGYTTGGIYPIDVCLEEGATYEMQLIDSYGDGWSGNSFSISTSSCDSIAYGGSDFTNGSQFNVPFDATCGDDVVDSGCPAPADWAVTVTGSNHTIMIPAGIIPQMAEGSELEHANVGVFFTNENGDLVCAGSTEIIPGETVQIAAMGDDTTTPEVDGLLAGDDLVWLIADCNGNVFAGQATYSNGPDVYTTNGLTFVASISEVPAGPSSQTLALPSGWSMFSTYMIADDMDMASVLSPIIDKVIIAKNNSGAAYLVEYNFNGVGDLIVGQGYQVKTTEAAEFEVSGAYAFPEENTLEITAGWNMIGYLRMEPAAADAVMADLNSTGNLIIAKDYNGAAYLPEYNFNGIGDMYPGQGYQLKTNDADELQYLSNDGSYRMSAIKVTENNVSHYAKVAATDNNMTVVIEDAAWDILPTEGSEIAAFDKDGNMVGSAIYSSPVTVVSVWGDDATTSSKDGMLVSESVSFKVWNTNEVSDFTVTKWIEGSSSYQVDGISVASTIETNNVMTELNTTERVLVKVINVLGQEVNLDDEPFKGTVLFNVYDDGTVEQFVR